MDITVKDDVAPKFETTPPSQISAECTAAPAYASYDAFVAAGGLATDNCSLDESSFTLKNQVISTQICPQTITRTYSIKDKCGLETTWTQTITLDDNTDPAADPLGQINVECKGDVPAPDISLVKATDNCDQDLTIVFSGDVNDGKTCPETITRTYRVTDDCGNYADVVQNFIILDKTAPKLSGIPVDATVLCSDVIRMPEVTATDNCDKDVKITFTEDK